MLDVIFKEFKKRNIYVLELCLHTYNNYNLNRFIVTSLIWKKYFILNILHS